MGAKSIGSVLGACISPSVFYGLMCQVARDTKSREGLKHHSRYRLLKQLLAPQLYPKPELFVYANTLL